MWSKTACKLDRILVFSMAHTSQIFCQSSSKKSTRFGLARGMACSTKKRRASPSEKFPMTSEQLKPCPIPAHNNKIIICVAQATSIQSCQVMLWGRSAHYCTRNSPSPSQLIKAQSDVAKMTCAKLSCFDTCTPHTSRARSQMQAATKRVTRWLHEGDKKMQGAAACLL